MFPGPYRAASKPGVFITMLAFFDIYSKHDLLSEENVLEYIDVRGIVGGYTVAVRCVLSGKNNDKDYFHFALSLCDGEWNHYFEWPFSKKITAIITHPRNSKKDIRLPSLRNEYHHQIKMPSPGSCNSEFYSEHVNWRDIELNGFIVNKTLYVYLEFE
ncbi:hypothetical protein MTO96_024426 [Rhipicephalus appendiculatus]